MHRCLSIVEVQRAIFREVHFDRKGSVTLARLARTCRAFHSAALDVLWAALDSFVLLIQSLPRDLWKIDLDRRMTFLRPMSLKDWEIWFKYSSRVRVLLQLLGPDVLTQCSSLGDDVIFALSNPPTYGPLVPYLRVLFWDKPIRKYASLLRLLLTPSLDTLSLTNCMLRSPEVSVLTSIGTVCPSLRTLTIGSNKPLSHLLDPKGEKILSEAILYLHCLESLTCPGIDEAAIIHLSHLPFLNQLSLELQVDFQLDKVKRYMAPPAFASVNSFKLHANSLSTVTSLLETMHFKPSRVSFELGSTPSPDALRLFFMALVNACDPERLARVSLTVTVERSRQFPLQEVSLSTFQSLLALPNIQAFEFDVPCAVSIGDEGIASLTKHWPKLSSLLINTRAGWGTVPRITHEGLLTLLSHCQELIDFSLSVDLSTIDVSPGDMPETRPGNGVTNESCVVGNFVTSPIHFPVTIAAFLSDVCPNMEAVNSSWNHGHPEVDDLDEIASYQERWEEVENLLPAFSAVRRQCLEWYTKKTKEEGEEEGSVSTS